MANSNQNREDAPHTENTIAGRKKTALHFLKLVAAGHIDEAYEEHAVLDGIHHNPYYFAGFPVLREAMIANHLQFPNMQLNPRHVLAEGDLVAVHSHIVLRPGEPGMAAMHLFRFKGDKIVELWDCAQPLPADSPNQDGMF